MKRIIISALVSLTVCLPSLAQTDSYLDWKNKVSKSEEEKPITFGVKLGIGGAPIIEYDRFNIRNTYSYGNYHYSSGRALSDVYDDYYGPINTTGIISAAFDINFSKRSTLSMEICFGQFWRDKHNSIDDTKTSRESGSCLMILPEYKLTYLSRSIINLYGSIGMGFSKYFGLDNFSSYRSRTNNSIKFEAQVVPFGIEIGKKLFGFAEFGVGSVYCGAKAGIGYRF